MEIKEIDTILKVVLEENNSILVVTPMGELNTYNSTQFQKQIEEVSHTGKYSKMLFDCSHLNYVSSTGIGAFTSLMKVCQSLHINMALSNIQPRVYEVFSLLGFTNFFRIFDDKSFAMKYFSEDLKPLFPAILQCPSCLSKLRVLKSGRFRCTKCKAIIVIDSKGNIFKE